VYRKNTQHLQLPLFSDLDVLPEKLRIQLEESWAGTFYRDVFVRIDERPFAVLYSDEPSRPNTPINVLAGLDWLKSAFGWSDEEMYDHYCFDIQVRYALGLRNFGKGHFELRTMYNFRRRVAQHMQKTGENLYAQSLEQIADEQVVAYGLKTHRLRMDSTQIASNIREMTRLRLLVEVLQRTHGMLSEADQRQFAEAFAPYLKGSSGQYTYRIKSEEYEVHLQQAGELMHQLTAALSDRYADEAAYQVLARVFDEHFVVEESTLRPKVGKELTADSLQSPDDWEATYRRKGGKDHIGYVANVTETSAPENPFQLIVKVQAESNNTDDAVMLAEVLPELKERTRVDTMDTDGGYNSPTVDEVMRDQSVTHVQTAIRGRQPENMGVHDFTWEVDGETHPRSVQCPLQQRVDVEGGRKPHRYLARFDATVCETCPLADQCPTQRLKRGPERVLRFSQQELDRAMRRQRCAAARAGPHNHRAAVEATVRAVKHPFRNGKVPVRGKPRVSMVLVGSAAMNNVRQIHRYLVRQRAEAAKKTDQRERRYVSRSLFVSFLTALRVRLSIQFCSLHLPRPVLACRT
jgi:hypothetical protein